MTVPYNISNGIPVKSVMISIFFLLLGSVFNDSTFGKDTEVKYNDAYFISLFDKYMTARRNLDVSRMREVVNYLSEKKELDTTDKKLVDKISSKIDVSHILEMQAGDKTGIKECLASVSCRVYALHTMQNWAVTDYKVNKIARNVSPRFVEFKYSGTDGDGIFGHGSVTFVIEGGKWKIGSESFSPVKKTGTK